MKKSTTRLTDVVKELETHKKVSDKEIKNFFESLDYSKAVVTTDRVTVKVKFNSDIIKIEDYPFPTEEESKNVFKYMGITSVITHYSKNGDIYFRTFEFNVDKNAIENRWYK